MPDSGDYLKIAELLGAVLAGIFVRANITAEELSQLNTISNDLAKLRQHEQDIADGKV